MIMLNGKRIDSIIGDALPIGTLSPFVGLVAPKGYLICMGQLVDKVKYPELWELCGDTFGPSTATQFYLPDLRGQTIAGYKEGDSIFGTLGGLIGSITKSYIPEGINTGGAVQSHTLTAAESGLPEHTHKLPLGPTVGVNGMDDIPARAKGSSGSDANFRSGRTTGTSSNPNDYGASLLNGKNASQGHNHGFTQPTFTGTQADINVIQPTIALNWIIKASMLAVVTGNIEDSLTSTSSTNALSAKQGKVLNDKIDDLEDNKQNTLITQAVSITTNFNIIVYRYGNVISVDIDGNVEASANEIIATGLPKAGYAWTYLPDVSGDLLFRVDSNGNLYARNNLSSWVNLHGTYISIN